MGLQDYLQTSKKNLGSLELFSTVHVVLGNEACDLDSAVSAIVYAFFLHQIHNDPKQVYLPVLNIPETDYSLRTEVAYALGLYEISQNDLIFLDQIDFFALEQKDALKLTLVDFNVFRGSDAQLEGSVVEVLDHHTRERPEKLGVDVVIETVGSCCTLVAEKIFGHPNYEEYISKEVFWLLYGTILMDTVCLSESAGRTSAKDLVIIDTLEKRLPKLNRKTIFDKLQTAKFDVSTLSTVDVLRKDLKLVKNSKITIAMSSIPMDMMDFLSKEDLSSSLDHFSSHQRAAAVIVMALIVDQQGEPHRQLAVYSTTPAVLAEVTEALQDANKPTLLLGEPLHSPSPHLFAYPQGNVKASRKLVLPLISDILQDMEAETEGNQAEMPSSSPNQDSGNEDQNPSVTTPEGNRSDNHKPRESATENGSQNKTEDKRESLDTNTSQSLSEPDSQTTESNKNNFLNLLEDFDTPVELTDNNVYSGEKLTSVDGNDKDNRSSDLLDPFHNETNIILENTPENTANTTPASGLSSRSHSPGNNDSMNPGASNFLLPGGGGSGGLGIPPVMVIPVTPINSPTDSPSDSNVSSPHHQVDLPSFHSYEMLQKIKEKKASVGGSDEVSDETDTFPYTPVNSLVDAAPIEQMSEHNLPSFFNRDMVQRINEKKEMLDGLLEEEGSEGEDVFPYPPKNSFTDSPSHMDMVTREVNLPSFNSAEMVQIIKEKKASLGFGSDTEESMEGQDCPYTPQNSLATGNSIHSLANDLELSNFHGPGIVEKVENKRISMDREDWSADHNAADNMSFTPPNSFANSTLSDIHRGPLVDKELIDKISAWTEDATSVQCGVDDSVSMVTPTATTGNVVAYRIAQDMLEHDEMNSDVVPDTDGADPEDFVIVKGESTEEVAMMITESVIQKAAAQFQQTYPEHLKEESLTRTVEKEPSPSPPMIVIEDTSTGTIVSEQEDPLALEGIAMYSSPSPSWSDNQADTAGASDLSTSDDSGIKMPDTDIVRVDDAAAEEDVGVPGDTRHQVKYTQNGSYDDTNISEGMLTLGSEVGESHTEEAEEDKTVPDRINEEAETVIQSQIANGILHLGTDPGESHTETATEREEPQPEKPDPHPTITAEGLLDLGSAPGESSTDIDVRAPEERDQADMITRTEAAKAIVNIAIHNAVEVCRQQPDGDTVQSHESSDRQPPDGSTGTNKNPEGATDNESDASKKNDDAKLTKQQRTHLEGVRKALDIDLDLSSEDEEEIKNLKDQIPEELTSPRFNFIPQEEKIERPSTLDSTTKKKILPNLDLLNDNDIDIPISPISTDDDIGLSIDDEKTPDDLTTPDVLNNSMFAGELDWGSGSSSTPVEPIPEYTAREEFEDARHWKSVQIGERWYKIDMKVIEPYKKVLSHGGYYGDGFNAIVVFTACYLPDRRRRDYHYVMDNLFLYVISTLELLVVEDYMIVYFHGATPRNKMPSLRWLKRCYDMIDRRLRKNLKGLLVVHPTIWLKTLVFMTRPFVSAKFSSKLRYIKNLDELTKAVPTEYIFVPDEVKQYDAKGNKSPSVPSPT